MKKTVSFIVVFILTVTLLTVTPAGAHDDFFWPLWPLYAVGVGTAAIVGSVFYPPYYYYPSLPVVYGGGYYYGGHRGYAHHGGYSKGYHYGRNHGGGYHGEGNYGGGHRR